MTNSPLTVLLVADNPANARFVHELRREAGAESSHLLHVEKLGAAYQRLTEEPVDIILLDLPLPDSEGADTLRRLRAQRDVPSVVLTGLTDEAAAHQMVGAGAQGYFLKGQIEGAKLVGTLSDAIAQHQARKEGARRSSRTSKVFCCRLSKAAAVCPSALSRLLTACCIDTQVR
jgi:CheY-like chemotaxis protein